MEECWREPAKNVANKQSVHSSTGQGDPDEWILPNWQQKDKNWDGAVAYDLRVDAARPWAKKE